MIRRPQHLSRGLALTAGAAALLGVASLAPANIVPYSTTFNSPTYTDGGLIGQDGWLITGASVVNPINVSSTATNGLVSLANNGQDVNRPFTPASTQGSVWVAADINVSAALTGDYFLHVSDGGTSNFYSRIYAKAGTTGFFLALATSSGTLAAGAYGTTELSFGTTYHILSRYDFVAGAGNDTGALFVNPVDPLGVGDTPYVAATTIGTDATTISAVNLRQGSATAAPTLTIDNITVTTTPAPGSLALLGLGGLLSCRRRRA